MKKRSTGLWPKPGYRKLTLIGSLLLTIAAGPAWAQGGPGTGGPPVFEEEPPTPPPTGVPIDGGATLLLAAGAGYGLKKLRDKRRQRQVK